MSLSKTKRTAFEGDQTIQKAACYDILCIAEAVARLILIDEGIVNKYPTIPWRQIAGIGNVMRHEYGRVDLNLVWDTVLGSDLENLLLVIDAEIKRPPLASG